MITTVPRWLLRQGSDLYTTHPRIDERVQFTAGCPACGQDVTWEARRTGETGFVAVLTHECVRPT